MIKFQEVYFSADKTKFEELSRLLSERGLVPPNTRNRFANPDKLVWEDRKNIGRYRVDFNGDHICFRYWLQRVTPELLAQDPMLESVREAYDFLSCPEYIVAVSGITTEITQERP